VNVTVTDLHGRTCFHDICWRPHVKEAIPIFTLVYQHFLLQQQQQPSSINNNVLSSNVPDHPYGTKAADDDTSSSSASSPPFVWPLTPDIRGHICFDYCRQEHWKRWNKYLQQQISELSQQPAETNHS
jgi:hypothetical protein